MNTRELIFNLMSRRLLDDSDKQQPGLPQAGPLESLRESWPNSGPRYPSVMDASDLSKSRGKGLHLWIQVRLDCIFQVRVMSPCTVASLKRDVAEAIQGSPAGFELLFQEEVLNDPDPLTEYGISEGDLLLISQKPQDQTAMDFSAAVESYHQRATSNGDALPALPPPTLAGSRARSARPLPPSDRSSAMG